MTTAILTNIVKELRAEAKAWGNPSRPDPENINYGVSIALSSQADAIERAIRQAPCDNSTQEDPDWYRSAFEAVKRLLAAAITEAGGELRLPRRTVDLMPVNPDIITITEKPRDVIRLRLHHQQQP